ncbi:MAG TPA: nucleotidyltransferase family protein [Thermodesulfovibrionales bacterium]|nr:nucleotidyltransferase family protein [Thermodesulfovibrionales bacterium]
MIFEADRINIVVLAGGINRVSLYDGYSAGYKALTLLEGRPMIRFVLDALDNVPQAGRICIVGPDEVRKGIDDRSRYEYAPGGNSLKESIFSGLGHFSDSPIVLFIPADLPLIRPATVIAFLRLCERTETSYAAAMFWAMVPEKSFTGPFIRVTKGFNRFRDISVCHGNLFLITPSVLKNDRITSRIDAVYDARKSSIKAALEIGPAMGLSYLVGVHLFRVMTLNQTARSLSRHLGMGMIPVLLEYPEVAVDIDTSEDYAFALEWIARQKADSTA